MFLICSDVVTSAPADFGGGTCGAAQSRACAGVPSAGAGGARFAVMACPAACNRMSCCTVVCACVCVCVCMCVCVAVCCIVLFYVVVYDMVISHHENHAMSCYVML